MKDNLTIGTRGSKLALYQANLVKEELLKCFKNLDVSISIIKTKGDQLLEKSLSSLLFPWLSENESEKFSRNSSGGLSSRSL